jgi:hypothetical protein
MPHLLDPKFVKLVSALPVADHRVEVQAADWAERCTQAGCLHLHTLLFAGRTAVQISRDWLHHAKISPELRCFAILLWGYPHGARGHERHWLAHLPAIAATAAAPATSWENYSARLRSHGHLGLFTISKLACFFGHVYHRLPALILDQRIVGVLQAGQWAELLRFQPITSTNASESYLGYLDCLHTLAAKTHTQGEQWEMFLFMFGEVF